MKVRLTVTLEVQEEDWITEYGTTPGFETRRDIRDHLSELTRNAIMEMPHVKSGIAALTRFE